MKYKQLFLEKLKKFSELKGYEKNIMNYQKKDGYIRIFYYFDNLNYITVGKTYKDAYNSLAALCELQRIFNQEKEKTKNYYNFLLQSRENEICILKNKLKKIKGE